VSSRDAIALIALGEGEQAMPTISMFYGIIIRLYFAPGEHTPPHFHAFYNEFKASIDIRTGVPQGHRRFSSKSPAQACGGVGRIAPGGIDGRLELGHEWGGAVQD
jgi:hypothetical protein